MTESGNGRANCKHSMKSSRTFIRVVSDKSLHVPGPFHKFDFRNFLSPKLPVLRLLHVIETCTMCKRHRQHLYPPQAPFKDGWTFYGRRKHASTAAISTKPTTGSLSSVYSNFTSGGETRISTPSDLPQ